MSGMGVCLLENGEILVMMNLRGSVEDKFT